MKNAYSLQHDAETDQSNCHVASMVISSLPKHKSQLIALCRSLPDSTVYDNANNPAFVLVVERARDAQLKEIISEINQMSGVLNVNLIYHHCETLLAMSEELES